MATQFQVDTDRIAAAAGDIARIAADLEAQSAAMMARLTGLNDAWTGSAAGQFQAVVTQWQATQRQVKTSLEDMGAVLAAAGVQYAQTEASALRMFS